MSTSQTRGLTRYARLAPRLEARNRACLGLPSNPTVPCALIVSVATCARPPSSGIGRLPPLPLLSTSIGISLPPLQIHTVLPPSRPCNRVTLHFTMRTSGDGTRPGAGRRARRADAVVRAQRNRRPCRRRLGLKSPSHALRGSYVALCPQIDFCQHTPMITTDMSRKSTPERAADVYAQAERKRPPAPVKNLFAPGCCGRHFVQ